MDIISELKERASKASPRIVLPESGDARIIEAAAAIASEGWAKPVLIGEGENLRSAAGEAGVGIEGIAFIDPKDEDIASRYAAFYAQARGVKEKIARRVVAKPLAAGCVAVAAGDAECLIAGAATTTALVISNATLAIGLAEGISVPSSFFLMVVPEALGRTDVRLLYADCAVNVQPSSAELAGIALAAAESARALLDDEPRIALLSFSTKGSASHEDADKVKAALEIVREKAPGLEVDGELQADAALVRRVAVRKCPESSVAGCANVLVFPDLDAGNIAYKLTQYLAGAQAFGPVLQGFRKPVSDLSRGASSADIVGTSAIVCAMAASQSSALERSP